MVLNIRQKLDRLDNMAGTNAPAYFYGMSEIELKSFITLNLGGNVINLFLCL